MYVLIFCILFIFKYEFNISLSCSHLSFQIGDCGILRISIPNGVLSPINSTTSFVDNMLSKESLFLREEISRISPDIDLTQEIDIDGETVSLAIPMTVEFFWPKAGR